MNAQAERERIVALCRELSAAGFLAATGGNVALRVDADRFVVTPSALDYRQMGAADVCVLRLHDLARLDGERAPSVESALHARVLKRRPDVSCSIHTHQPVASACALLGEPLEVGDAACRRTLGPVVPIVGYAPSGTGWLARRLQAQIRPGHNAYLMRNHGVLCCGASVEAAVAAVHALERLCAQVLRERIAARAEGLPAALRPALEALLDTDESRTYPSCE